MKAEMLEFEVKPVRLAGNRSTNHLWFDKVFCRDHLF
jgi:hypothetical protein